MRWLVLAFVVGLALGCAPEITPPDGVFVCSSTAECPPDMTCVAGTCRRTAAPDGGGIDGGSPPADADLPDAGPRPDAEVSDDAGPPAPPAPRLVYPWNGMMTGSVHTGALPAARNALRPRFRWEEVEGAARYELELTHQCEATSFDACDFSSATVETIAAPTTEFTPVAPLDVSTTPPVGRRWFFRLRACFDNDACTPYTSIRYADVGRMANDFDGDGYSEYLASARGGGFSEMPNGRVYVMDTARSSIVELTSPVPSANDGFGFPLVVAGDVNADGFPDVAISATGTASGGSTRAGAVYVFLGSASGLDPARSVTLAPAAPRENGYFGQTMAPLDVDLDGYSDLVIGHSGEDVGAIVSAGAALVYHGEAGGVATVRREVLTAETPRSAGGFPGYGMQAIGDVDGDGFPDLAIPDTGYDFGGTVAGAGAVFVYGGPDLTEVVPTMAGMATPSLNASFGSSLAGNGDMNDDGYADMVVAAFDTVDSVRGGSVFMFIGGPDGLRPGPEPVVRSPIAGDNFFFGNALAIDGDLNGDGYDDMLVGEFQGRPAPMTMQSGALYVFLGHPTDPLMTPSYVAIPPSLPDALTWYGRFATYGHRDADGFADFATGAPTLEVAGVSSVGAVFLFSGGASGVTLDNSIPPPAGDQVMQFEFGETGL